QSPTWVSEILEKGIKHAVISLHGGDGEDGTVQGALDVLGVTYTGSGVLGSAIGMDKLRSKQLWKGIGLSTADYVLLTEASDWSSIMAELNGKCIVKPAQEGSSIGMQVATDEISLQRAFEDAKQYGTDVIAERWIQGPEFTVAILGDEALPVIQMQTDNDFYDYEAKYQANDTRYLCPCGLDEPEESVLKQLALDAFSSLDCKGWGRVDIMIDERTNTPYVLEVNTSPGMTSHSLVPMAAKAKGISFEHLVLTVLELSVA
ncbi:MAG: D-alanine--D-alanine ligase, partial [Pseudomonadota bacterium]